MIKLAPDKAISNLLFLITTFSIFWYVHHQLINSDTQRRVHGCFIAVLIFLNVSLNHRECVIFQ